MNSAANTNIVNSTARAATILDDFHNFVKPAAFGINSLASSAKYQVKIMPARKDHKPQSPLFSDAFDIDAVAQEVKPLPRLDPSLQKS